MASYVISDVLIDVHQHYKDRSPPGERTGVSQCDLDIRSFIGGEQNLDQLQSSDVGQIKIVNQLTLLKMK